MTSKTLAVLLVVLPLASAGVAEEPKSTWRRIEDIPANVRFDDGGNPDKINFYSAEVTNGDLAVLEKMPSLKEVCLYETSITDDGLQHLAKSPELTFLKIVSTSLDESVDPPPTKITGEGFKHLAKCQNLTFVTILNCEITDEGLEAFPAFPAFPKLKRIIIKSTKVTKKGIDRLSEKYAKVEIQNDFGGGGSFGF